MSIIQPTNNTSLIIDDFINYATAHLSTVSGIVTTISSYPPATGPGILLWSGYVVPPDTSAPINEQNDDSSEVEGLEVSEYEKANGPIPKEQQIDPKTQTSNFFNNINAQKTADTSYILPSVIEVISEVQSVVTDTPEVISEVQGEVTDTTEVSDVSVPTSLNPNSIPLVLDTDDELPPLPPPIPLPTRTTPAAIQRLESGPAPQVYRNVGATAPPRPPGLNQFENGLIDIRLLVSIGNSGNSSRYGGQFLLHPEAAQNFFKLKQQASAEGISFRISSAYRDRAYQQELAGRSKTPGSAAPAGSSSHGWGVAIDFGDLYGALEPRGSTNPIESRRARERSPLYRWLSINGPKYGWYNPWRLADGRGVDEIWHWEYWGFADWKRR